MRRCDPATTGVDRLATGRTAMVPFLPTLVTALAIGGLSLLCREPAAPPPQDLSPGSSAIAPAASMTMAAEVRTPPSGPVRETVEWPASLLLSQLPPPAMVEAPPAPMRGAARRPCAGLRCETRRTLAARPAPAATPARPSPDPALAQRDVPGPDRTGALPPDALPEDTLPFVPVADRVWDAARGLGNRVVAMSASVSDALPSLY